MRVRFFGVRGSTPTPGPSTVRYGGNTVCVEARLADGTVLILDAGTGIRELGKELVREQHQEPITLLLTHVHWDHIQGLPFFGPLWQRGSHLRILPLPNFDQNNACRQLILFDGIHFPVHARDIPAKLERLEDNEATYRVGSATIKRIALNHPGGAQGFRIDDDGGHSIAYLTDNEIGQAPPLASTVDELAAFAEGCELVIHDAQYLEGDMPAKRGWGHSTLPEVLEFGKRAATPHLVLFHHEPERDDDALDAIGERANAWLGENAPGVRATVATEGLTIEV
jgi:phosphoribosyl 1,2-cyclic phosphodiesterase